MRKRNKGLAVLLLPALLLTSCGSEPSVAAMSVNAIEKDLGIEITPAVCKYNEEKKLAYVEFTGEAYPSDQAVLKLDENNQVERILYQHIYEGLTPDDYEMKKLYGDYALAALDIEIGDDRWVEVEAE